MVVSEGMLIEDFIPVMSLLIGAFFCIVIISIVWGNIEKRGTFSFILLLLSILLWSLGYTFEIILPEVWQIVLCAKIEYIGIVIIPVAWLTFCAEYTGKLKKLVTGKILYALYIIPILTVILVFTNEYHNLIWTDMRLSAIGTMMTLRPLHGIWFWVHTVYSYILFLGGTALLIGNAISLPSVYKKQSIMVTTAAIVPWIANMAYLSHAIEFDITPVAFVITSSLLLATTYQHRFLQILPVARSVTIENMSDGLIVLDAQNRIVDINPVSEKIFGISRDEVIGKKAVEVFTQYPQVVEMCWKEDGTPRELHIEGNSTRYYSVKVSNLKDPQGNPIGKVILLHDITRLKEVEADLKQQKKELEKLNKELDDRVKERTREVEFLLKQKNEFISQLGHDLRTPLTPIISLLPLVREKEKDPKLRELLDIVTRNANYMKNLVSDTLELARLNSPKVDFKFESVYLKNLIDESIRDNEYILKKRNIVWENLINDDILVKADQLRIREVLTNLISNSAKFTPPGGKLTFSAEPAEGYVLVKVSDTGIGLDGEQKNKIFTEFYKTDKSRQSVESSGLGLTICKRIVEKHGGKIWAESDGLGKGTTICFTLPAGKADGDEK
ncbi:MAG TPA: PAS domain S-box protein [Thermoplasmatales archaeon]|nr:PAS domain S-box protein [Thermoplasmatales archaeon]